MKYIPIRIKDTERAYVISVPDVATDNEILDCDLVILQLLDELKEMKSLAHEGLPNDCVAGYDEVKFCHNRQGEGNLCKHCSKYD
jgi:hypothetical protein